MRIQRALISVSNKRRCRVRRGLAEMGVELVSTGGTAKALPMPDCRSSPWIR